MSDATSTEPAPSGGTKNCPLCGELILATAQKCRYCRTYLDPSARPHALPPSAADRMLLPVGRPTSAIASGYLALFSVLPLIGLLPAVASIICGVVALKAIRNDPSLSGKGRAWFGIIFSSLMLVATLLFVIWVLVEEMKHGRR